MKNTNYSNRINNQIVEFKTNILYIEKLLREYVSEDKVHLFAIHKRLKEKLKNLEAMLEKLRSCDEQNQEDLKSYSSKYFNQFKGEFGDFLIILRWSHFSLIHEKLHILSKGKASTPYIEKRNSMNLLDILNEGIK